MRPKAKWDVRTVLDVRAPCYHVMAWAMWGEFCSPSDLLPLRGLHRCDIPSLIPTHSLLSATWVSHMCCHTLSEHRWGYIRLTISPKEPMRQDFVMSATSQQCLVLVHMQWKTKIYCRTCEWILIICVSVEYTGDEQKVKLGQTAQQCSLRHID